MDKDLGLTTEVTITDFLTRIGLQNYIKKFVDQEVQMETLEQLSGPDLIPLVPEYGFWNRLCRARDRHFGKINGNQGLKEFNIIDLPYANLSEFFLANDFPIEPYLEIFNKQGIGLEELLYLSDTLLHLVVRKLGPWTKLRTARAALIAQYQTTKGSCSHAKVPNSEEGVLKNLKQEDTAVPDEKNKETRTLNLLVVGETGVGKSIFINAFANYLTFETMEAAFGNGTQLLSLIPSKYTLTDADGELREVSASGEKAAENEDQTAGQSATQTCRSYYFPFRGGNIRLIDTPDIGEGIKQDKINVENILGFISQHDEDLHGICILVQPHLTAAFTYCIKELLCNLQKIIFRVASF